MGSETNLRPPGANVGCNSLFRIFDSGQVPYTQAHQPITREKLPHKFDGGSIIHAKHTNMSANKVTTFVT